MGKSILEFKGIGKRFPGVQALDQVSFSLNEGEVLALIGENGAGKSTLMKCLTGANRPDDGSIILFGKEYTYLTPKEAKELGISIVYQEFNLIPDLPVVENIFIGNLPCNGFIVDDKEMLKRAQAVFDDFNVKIDPRAKLSTLSPAMMQIVEIAKAISLNCRILILDEPTAPLTESETEILFTIINKAKQRGVSVIYISHRMEEIFRICDRAVILRDGQYIAERNMKDTNRAELIKLMIGREIDSYYPEHVSVAQEEVVMEVKHLWGNGCRDISFCLHKGEILGIAGLVGAGRTELLSVLFCDAPKERGEMILRGNVFRGKKPWDAIKKGISLLPEDRKVRGLLLDKSILINMTLAAIKKYCHMGVIDEKTERETAQSYCSTFGIKSASLQKEAKYLSGGNQQKVIIAKWLDTDSDIFLFDEPTRGIDVGAKHEIYELIHSLADEGKSLIVVSSEFEELIGIADRILVMSEGEMMGSVEKTDFNKELLLDMASGKR